MIYNDCQTGALISLYVEQCNHQYWDVSPKNPVLDRLRGKLQRVICLQDFIQVKKQVMGEMGLHGVGAPLGERRSLVLTMCFCMMSPSVFEMRQEPKLTDTMISFVESQKGIPST